MVCNGKTKQTGLKGPLVHVHVCTIYTNSSAIIPRFRSLLTIKIRVHVLKPQLEKNYYCYEDCLVKT